MTTLPQLLSDSQWIDRTFARLKEGDGFQPCGSEKIFIKMGGVLVAPDMEAYTWIKTKTSPEFFNNYVVRILYSSRQKNNN